MTIMRYDDIGEQAGPGKVPKRVRLAINRDLYCYLIPLLIFTKRPLLGLLKIYAIIKHERRWSWAGTVERQSSQSGHVRNEPSSFACLNTSKHKFNNNSLIKLRQAIYLNDDDC